MPKEAFAGITTVVAPHVRPYLCEVVQHNPKHTTISINSNSGTVHFHEIHAPHDKLDYKTVKIQFWDTLDNHFSATPLPEPSYIIGDLNVRLHGRSNLEHQILGPHIFGKGPQLAKRGLTDNCTLFTNMLQGHDAEDVMTFKTPNLVTYRDKSHPPQDWSTLLQTPSFCFIILLQMYDKTQSTHIDDSSHLRIASKIRSFIASETLPSLPPPPKKTPCNGSPQYVQLELYILQASQATISPQRHPSKLN